MAKQDFKRKLTAILSVKIGDVRVKIGDVRDLLTFLSATDTLSLWLAKPA